MSGLMCPLAEYLDPPVVSMSTLTVHCKVRIWWGRELDSGHPPSYAMAKSMKRPTHGFHSRKVKGSFFFPLLLLIFWSSEWNRRPYFVVLFSAISHPSICLVCEPVPYAVPILKSPIAWVPFIRALPPPPPLHVGCPHFWRCRCMHKRLCMYECTCVLRSYRVEFSSTWA